MRVPRRRSGCRRSRVRRRMTSHPGISSPCTVEPTQSAGPGSAPCTTMSGILTREASRRYALSMYPVAMVPRAALIVPISNVSLMLDPPSHSMCEPLPPFDEPAVLLGLEEGDGDQDQDHGEPDQHGGDRRERRVLVVLLVVEHRNGERVVPRSR